LLRKNERKIGSDLFKGQKILIDFAKRAEFKPMAKEIDFKSFKRIIKRGDEGNRTRLCEIIKFKKIFCIPWLLCYQQLFMIQ